MKNINLDRRHFLKLSVTSTGAALVLGVNWSCGSDAQSTSDVTHRFAPNAWIRIDQDDSVTIIVAESEMGQGPYTLMPMMVAEELEVPWQNIRVERASADPVYGYQMTGGSSSIRKGWNKLRQAGAVARDILITAAAQQLSVPVKSLKAEHGFVVHADTSQRLAYSELLDSAAKIAIPERVLLKEPREFKIIGRSVRRTDTHDKISGKAIYGIDVKLPDQLYATVVHSPVYRGKVKSYDRDSVLKLPNAIDVIEIREGIALVAKDTWSAFKMADALKVEWDEGEIGKLSQQDIIDRVRASDSGILVKNIGALNADLFHGGQTRFVESQYLQPFQAHMTMEPMNCTAHFKPSGDLDIWAPTQSPTAAYKKAKDLSQSALERNLHKISSKLTGSYDDSIRVNTTLLGGGFGRRLKQDYVSEAVQVAAHFNSPVQVVWRREEDVRCDYYHPMTFHEMQSALGDDGMPVAWKHIVRGFDVDDRAADHLYDIPEKQIQVYKVDKIVRHGPWRSVAAHYNVFAVEHFIDELAHRAGKDPLQYRLKLLHKSPRMQKVLQKLAEQVGWQGSLNGRLSYGVAGAFTFGSYVAHVVELEKLADDRLRINRVTCAIDCGTVISPDIVRQQMEGSIIYGLSAALNSEITFENGRVVQSNFHDNPILRMDECPQIDVVIIESNESPEGIGEPGVPPVAPALANAIYAQTGVPVRKLPVSLSSA